MRIRTKIGCKKQNFIFFNVWINEIEKLQNCKNLFDDYSRKSFGLKFDFATIISATEHCCWIRTCGYRSGRHKNIRILRFRIQIQIRIQKTGWLVPGPDQQTAPWGRVLCFHSVQLERVRYLCWSSDVSKFLFFFSLFRNCLIIFSRPWGFCFWVHTFAVKADVKIYLR